MSSSFLKGIAFALGACLIWGLIFVVPQFMTGFTPVEIALGRYTTYGCVSLLILLKVFLQGGGRYPFKIWMRAVYFSLASSFAYYIFVILALRYSTPAICALILGVSPIAIAFYGNWREKECTYQSLIVPSILIAIGLVVINAPNVMMSSAPSTYLLGLLCAFWALIAWSWYVVVNAHFLKTNPEVKSGDWSTLLGVSTLFWVVVVGSITMLFFEDQVDWSKYFNPGPEFISYLMGCATLGIVCSWVGAFLWNKASVHLPVSFAGQLTIFETIFGICFIYALEGSLPPTMEILGVAFLLTAIVYGIRAAAQAEGERIIS